jgi:hypothetical protein
MAIYNSIPAVIDQIESYFDVENPKLSTGYVKDLIYGGSYKITITNGTHVTTTPKYYSFNGANTSGAISLSSGYSYEPHTIELVVRPQNLTGNRTIYSTNQYDIIFANNQIGLYHIYDDAIKPFSTPTTFVTNNWYHIAVTIPEVYDNDSSTAYVNGISQGTTSAFSIYDIFNRQLGYSVNAPTNLFLGDFSILRTYGKTLTQSEIIQNYNAAKTRYGI